MNIKNYIGVGEQQQLVDFVKDTATVDGEYRPALFEFAFRVGTVLFFTDVIFKKDGDVLDAEAANSVVFGTDAYTKVLNGSCAWQVRCMRDAIRWYKVCDGTLAQADHLAVRFSFLSPFSSTVGGGDLIFQMSYNKAPVLRLVSRTQGVIASRFCVHYRIDTATNTAVWELYASITAQWQFLRLDVQSATVRRSALEEQVKAVDMVNCYRRSGSAQGVLAVPTPNIAAVNDGYVLNSSRWVTSRKITASDDVSGETILNGSADVTFKMTVNQASKLRTPRKINGVSFDGTADITIADGTKLPLGGGVMSGQIRCKGIGGQWIEGGRGDVGLINITHSESENAAYPILRQKVGAGAFTLSAFQNKWTIGFYTNADISAGTNRLTHAFHFDSDGILTAGGFKGKLEGKATTAGRADEADRAEKVGWADVRSQLNIRPFDASKHYNGSLFMQNRGDCVMVGIDGAGAIGVNRALEAGTSGKCIGNSATASRSETNVFRISASAIASHSSELRFHPLETQTGVGRFSYGLANTTWTLYHGGDNTYAANLGRSGAKWKNIYAINGTIQTSDRNAKKDIEVLTTQTAQQLIMGLAPKTYRMTDGDSGRVHWGLIAQDIEKLLEETSITDMGFAGFIRSPETILIDEESTDENGETVVATREEHTGRNLYSLRYDEFIAPLITLCQEHQRCIDALKEEVRELRQAA